jgi:hypothetical protein
VGGAGGGGGVWVGCGLPPLSGGGGGGGLVGAIGPVVAVLVGTPGPVVAVLVGAPGVGTTWPLTVTVTTSEEPEAPAPLALAWLLITVPLATPGLTRTFTVIDAGISLLMVKVQLTVCPELHEPELVDALNTSRLPSNESCIVASISVALLVTTVML